MTGRTLVVGVDGMMGAVLMSQLRAAGDDVIGTSRRESHDPSLIYYEMGESLDEVSFPLDIERVYLCAAITSLRSCKLDPEQTAKVNVDATINLAKMFVERGAFVLFPSTNLVFDGAIAKTSANVEVNPVEIYGQQKVKVEKALLSMGENVAILRLTKVVDSHFPLFNRWAERLKSGGFITPFSDMVFAPVTLQQTVDLLITLGKRRLSGVFQFSAARDISYAEAALLLAIYLGLKPEQVKSCNCDDVDYEGGVPRFTSLDCSRVVDELGVSIPDPYEVLGPIFHAISALD